MSNNFGHPATHEAVRVIGQRVLGERRADPWHTFTLAALGLQDDELRRSVQHLTPMLGHLVASVLATDAARERVQLHDAWQPDLAPTAVTLQRSDGPLTFPGETISVWKAQDDEARLVIRLFEQRDGAWAMHVASSAEHFAEACRRGSELIDRAHEVDNPLRGCHLTATQRHDDVALDAAPHPVASRHDLRMSDTVWNAVDRNVHRALRRADAMRALDLGQRRGLLFHGPPGTGKTHLGRVIAAELAGKATTIVVDRVAMVNEIGAVYRYAAWLAPSVVFLEDVDVIAARRAGPSSTALQELLNEMDGPLTPDRPVITVATTNDLAALDEAAVRSGRFDEIVEVPHPDVRGRRMILQRYIDALDEDVDVDVERVAYATSGASGADLRELFRRALLDTDGEVTTATLLRLLAGGPTGEQDRAYL